MTMVLKDKSSEQLRTKTLSGNGHAQQDLGTITGLVLRPEMSYCDAGRAVLGYHLNRLLANEAGTIEGDDPEPLHQMRVATRRLRAALRDFATAFGDELDPFVREVRWLSRLLGRIRDLDVFIAWLREYEQNAPAEQRPLVHIIVHDRETARVRERAALLTGLRSGRYNDFTRTFSQFVHAEATPTQCNHQPLIDMAASKVERQLARVRRAARRADANHLKRLHQLRIECKRLRYTTEFFSTLFPDRVNRLAKRASAVQDDLGRVHDTYMHRQFLKQMRQTHASNPVMADTLKTMIQTLRREQDDAYKEFKRDYKRLGSKKARRRFVKRLDQIAGA